MVQQGPLHSVDALPAFLHRAVRHVARTVRDRSDEPATRLSAQRLGTVLVHQEGRNDSGRHHGTLYTPVVPVYPIYANDFDFSNSRFAAAIEGRGIMTSV